MQGFVKNTFVAAVLFFVVFSTGQVSAAEGGVDSQDRDGIGRLLMADQLVIFSRLELTSAISISENQRPSQEAFIRSGILLDLALGLVDDDPEIWQLRSELAEQAGDVSTQVRTLRRYCQLVPEDEAAMLKLILELVNQRQTVEERLQAVRPLLSNQGEGKFSDALRSRLASYAAELAHDSGDTKAFGEYLKLGTQLDSTNVQAVLMAADYAEATGREPLQVGGLLVSAVAADPVDRDIRLRLGRLLLELGDYRNAGEQLEVAVNLSRDLPDLDKLYDLVLTFAGSDRTEEALTLIAQMESFTREQAKLAAAKKQGVSIIDEKLIFDENSVHIPLNMELLRLAILITSSRENEAAGIYQSIKGQLESQIESGDEKAKNDLVWMQLMVGKDLPDVEVIEALLEGLSEDDPARARIGGWYAFRQGEVEKAKSMLEPRAENDAYAAYGMGLMLDENDDQTAGEYLQRVYEMVPGKLVGLMAARVMADRYGGVKMSSEAERLGAMVKSLVRRVRKPDMDSRPWTRVNVQMEKTGYDYLEPMYAKIELRNISGRALSMGPDMSLPGDLMIKATTDLPGRPPMQTVVNVGRKLKLDNQERIVMRARVDRGMLGLTLSRDPLSKVNLRFDSVYGPMFDYRGSMIRGPLGDIDSQRLIERRGSAVNAKIVPTWIAELGGDDEFKVFQAAAKIALVIPTLSQNPQSQAAAEEASIALNSWFIKASEVEQAWAVQFMSSKPEHSRLFNDMHKTATRSESPLVRIMYLAHLVDNPTSSHVTAGMRDENPLLREFAKATVIRIEDQKKAEAKAAEAAEKAKAEEDEKLEPWERRSK